MTVRSLILAIAAAMVLTAPVQAQTPRALSAKDAVWARTPSGNDIANYYPENAARNGVSGWAAIQCLATDKGLLANCRVLGEAPRDQHFGDAALKLSRLFKLAPASKTGRLVAGDVIILPIILAMPGKTGFDLPKDYIAGGPAVLVTTANSANSRTFACPSARLPNLQCEGHAFTWETSPSLAETTDLVRGAVGDSRTTTLNCGLDAERRLKGCVAASAPTPAQEDAMRRLGALFVAPVEANDKTPMAQGRILIDFHWPALRAAVEAQIPTAP
jgi:TonB family protein